MAEIPGRFDARKNVVSVIFNANKDVVRLVRSSFFTSNTSQHSPAYDPASATHTGSPSGGGPQNANAGSTSRGGPQNANAGSPSQGGKQSVPATRPLSNAAANKGRPQVWQQVHKAQFTGGQDDEEQSTDGQDDESCDISRLGYIVVFKPGVSEDEIEDHYRWVAEDLVPDFELDEESVFNLDDFNAYVGYFDNSTADTIRSESVIESIEKDTRVQIQSNDHVQRSKLPVPWGILSLTKPKAERPSGAEEAKLGTGEGSHVYVLDTGINAKHIEFGGRVSRGHCLSCNLWQRINKSWKDTEGHGTAVASVVAGTTVGVAKKTNIIDVKVTCGGSLNGLTLANGLKWIVADVKKNKRQKRSVVHMSLGVLVVSSAGNEGIPSQWRSPLSKPGVIIVGAYRDSTRRELATSNYGRGVDILAPGFGILSADVEDDSDYIKETGTSFSAPFVSGLALTLIASRNFTVSPEEVKDMILNTAQKDVTVLETGEEGLGKGIPRSNEDDIGLTPARRLWFNPYYDWRDMESPRL
ncbi:hypothetical protein CDD80_1907 [Ophiocordyceps camponoti-rufipedis]|uniref:Peptidase S8/S53 domain-containing protein n=1 Tax=Ophiocordyceps camponoti-rufipedis TaxID=2004952 RepID=A0A2C5Z7J9_9HYPO|nr:hypothetical protein CDD80_1907 [Ophiocordyceps camponoti-rufipedis]